MTVPLSLWLHLNPLGVNWWLRLASVPGRFAAARSISAACADTASARVNRRIFMVLELFDFDRDDGRADDEDPFVSASIVGIEEEAVPLRVVVGHAADDFAIGEFHCNRAAARRLELLLGTGARIEDRFDLAKWHVVALAVALDREQFSIGIDRGERRALGAAVAIAKDHLRISHQNSSRPQRSWM